MRSTLASAAISVVFTMGAVTSAVSQGAVPPAGDVKALEPPIDQRQKQDLGTSPPVVVAPATKSGKVDAPDAMDKGKTDAR